MRKHTHGVIVARSSKGAAELGDLAAGFVDGDDIPRLHLLLGQGVYHFGAQVVDCLHLRRLHGQLALHMQMLSAAADRTRAGEILFYLCQQL